MGGPVIKPCPYALHDTIYQTCPRDAHGLEGERCVDCPEANHAARRSLRVEVEPVAVGAGYVARVAVEHGGAAVIVQPTWGLLVEALAEHLRGMGA